MLVKDDKYSLYKPGICCTRHRNKVITTSALHCGIERFEIYRKAGNLLLQKDKKYATTPKKQNCQLLQLT